MIMDIAYLYKWKMNDTWQCATEDCVCTILGTMAHAVMAPIARECYASHIFQASQQACLIPLPKQVYSRNQHILKQSKKYISIHAM